MESKSNETHVEWRFDENNRGRRIHVGCGGGVTLQDGRPKCHRCGAVDSNAGWIKRVLMWNWHWIALDGYPGWDLVGEVNDRHPPFVKLAIVKGKDRPARDIEIEWTSDGIPFVHDGETYHAGFWFEKLADREAFVGRYGGSAS
jgi:hypothetical protein